MDLYLMRHGHAPEAADSQERALSPRGIRECELNTENALKTCGLNISRIFHSSKLRARQTAEILASRVFPEPECGEAKHLLPLDDTDWWRQRLQSEHENTALVGHMPFLADLTVRLLGENSRSMMFRTGQIVHLRRDAKGAWRLVSVFPV